MAIAWGTYNGHLRVGIDYSISPSNPSHSDTTVQVTWKFYVGTDGWNFNDHQTLHVNTSGWGGASVGFHNTLTSGRMLVRTQKVTYAISSNSGNASASANLTGAYNGATPSRSRQISLPNRPAGVPARVVTNSASDVTTNSATISWSEPNDNGQNIDKYEARLDDDSGFASVEASDPAVFGLSWATGAVLASNTKHYFQVRAHNAAGWGPWSTAGNFTTAGGTPSTPGTPQRLVSAPDSIQWGWVPSAANGGTGLTYSVEIYDDAGLTSLVESVSGITTTTHTFTGLTASTTHWARVKATTSLGDSAWSATGSGSTLAPQTYDDAGALSTRINNFAEAVAEKLCHLGTFVMRGKDASFTLTEDAWYDLDADVAIDSIGPDQPTHASGDLTIAYEGTYQIEFAANLPTAAGGYVMSVHVNGNEQPTTTAERGTSEAFGSVDNPEDRPTVHTAVRRFAVGDDLEFRIYNNTGANRDVDVMAGGLSTWYRVTMIGF